MRPLTWLITVVGLALGALAWLVSDSISAQIVLGSLSLFFLSVAAARAMALGKGLGRSLTATQLGPWFGLSTGLVFGLAGLAWVDGTPPQVAGLLQRESVLPALIVIGVGLGSLTLGYLAAPTQPVRAVASRLRRWIVSDLPVRRGQAPAWLLLSIALLAYAAQIGNGSFGYLSDPSAAVSNGNPISNLLVVFTGFGILAAALSAHDYAEQRGWRRLLSLITVLAIQIIVGALSGVKGLVVLPVVVALLGYSASTGRPPLIPALLALPAFLFVVVPFTTNYRTLVNVGSSRLTLDQVFQQVSQEGPGYFLTPAAPLTGEQSPIIQTAQRMSRIGDIAIIVQRTPTAVANRPLAELLEAPVLGFIPRALWPGKPILATGYEFSQQYYDLPASVHTSNAVTLEGDLWRHGGWAVIAGGMLLFGVGVRILDVAAKREPGRPLGLLLSISFIVPVVSHEIDAVGLLASIPSTLFGVWLATRIVGWRGTSAHGQVYRRSDQPSVHQP